MLGIQTDTCMITYPSIRYNTADAITFCERLSSNGKLVEPDTTAKQDVLDTSLADGGGLLQGLSGLGIYFLNLLSFNVVISPSEHDPSGLTAAPCEPDGHECLLEIRHPHHTSRPGCQGPDSHQHPSQYLCDL